MSMRVNVLSDAARAALPAHLRAWTAQATSTDPVDWKRWEAGVQACYQYAGLRAPVVITVPSPLALARALFMARVNEVPGDEDRAVIGVLHRVIVERLDRVHSRMFGRPALLEVARAVHDPLDASTGAGADRSGGRGGAAGARRRTAIRPTCRPGPSPRRGASPRSWRGGARTRGGWSPTVRSRTRGGRGRCTSAARPTRPGWRPRRSSPSAYGALRRARLAAAHRRVRRGAVGRLVVAAPAVRARE